MNIYIESSSVLAWLLGGHDAPSIMSTINKAETVASSILTLMETERGLIRAENRGLISGADVLKLRGLLIKSIGDWIWMEITEEVQSRTKKPFPIEPIRTLDAVHLATSLEFLATFPELKVLSHDRRILANLEPLGLGKVDL